MYLFGMSTVLCSSLQLLLRQAPACVSWDGVDYLPLRATYACPDLDIVLITILMCILISVVMGMWYVAGIIAVLFFIGVFITSILAGTATVNQALLSAAIGTWLFFLFRFLPPLFVPLSAVLLMIPSIVFYIIFIVAQGKDSEIVAVSVVPGIRGCMLLAVNMYLYLRFVKFQDDFEWLRVEWDRGGDSGSGSGGDAVIPQVISDTGDVFGTRLSRDMIDSGCAFGVVLVCNLFVGTYFDYALFAVS
jgi:hypothetical protein